MAHESWPDFDLWWEEVKRVGEDEDIPVNEDDPEAYRHYYNDDYSPLDAVMEDAAAA